MNNIARNVADAAQEKTIWNARSVGICVSFEEVLVQVKRSADTDCGHQTMRHAYSAMKLGNWEIFKEE